MGKQDVGLPADQTFGVDLTGLLGDGEEPAEIEDFVDQELNANRRKQEEPKKQNQTPKPKSSSKPAKLIVEAPSANEASPAVRKRPPRKEIGFDPETLNMLAELHRDGCDQSGEQSLTRSEVARAAIRAIREARNRIDYSRCSRRGKWGSVTQRALLDNLTEAYTKAIYEMVSEKMQS